jgi:hypothetical protein
LAKQNVFGNTKEQVEMKLDRTNSQEINTKKGMGGLAVSLIADTQRTHCLGRQILISFNYI